MANTYVKIAEVTVGAGGAASIDFTSIPSTYTDLVLKVSLKTNRSSDSIDVAMFTFNGNTANRSFRELNGSGSGVGTQSSTTSMRAAMTNGNTGGTETNVWGNGEIYIPNYAGSNNKSYSSDSVNENNATQAYTAFIAGLWADTAAITSISMAPLVGTLFVQYSTAYLYGILKS